MRAQACPTTQKLSSKKCPHISIRATFTRVLTVHLSECLFGSRRLEAIWVSTLEEWQSNSGRSWCHGALPTARSYGGFVDIIRMNAKDRILSGQHEKQNKMCDTIPFTFIKNTPTQNDTLFKKTYAPKSLHLAHDCACRLWRGGRGAMTITGTREHGH